MIRVIHKYPMDFDCTFLMPAHAQVLSVQMQPPHPMPMLWALHPKPETAITLEERRFQLFGTGRDIDMEQVLRDEHGQWKHVATVQDGPFVWHVFEVKP
jgi:hypothetical protein